MNTEEVYQRYLNGETDFNKLSKKIYGVMRVCEEDITSLPITRVEMEEYLGKSFDDCK